MNPIQSRLFLTIFALFRLLPAAKAQGPRFVTPNVSWDPVTPEQLALAVSKPDAAAGFEAIFHRTHVRDEVAGGESIQRTLDYYIRLKVFNEKGQEQAATVRIPFSRYGTVSEIGGRTIWHDGSILELKSTDIAEQRTFSAAGFKQKVTTFAMPGLVPRAIVEYRWREIRMSPTHSTFA